MNRFRPLDDLGAAIRDGREALAEEVVGAWDRIAGDEPWLRLPADVGHDHLPDLIGVLADIALCTFFDSATCERRIDVALRHGSHRRDDGFDEALLFREYHLLRRALWRHLRATCADDMRCAEAILRIDAAITHATSASLRGFHRRELEAMGKWDEVVERLIADLPVDGLDPEA